MKPEGVIASRLRKAVEKARRVGLGRGIPQLARSLIPKGVEIVELNGAPFRGDPLDVVVVEAAEVTPEGDFSPAHGTNLEGVRGRRWIAAMRQLGEDGRVKIVRRSRQPVSRAGRIQEIITELGLIEVEPLGFVLREVAPGVSSDDVRHAVDASLHVADDLRVMEW